MDDQITVTYVETPHDCRVREDDGSTTVYGLPYRAEHDGLRAAATTRDGARAMIRRMQRRRVASRS